MQKRDILLLILGIVVVNLNFIYADSGNLTANVTLSYPSQINYGQVFTFNLKLDNFPNETYDVRIDILNDSERIARIWNGASWQSTYYYLNDAINTSLKNNESFQLNITSCFNGIADMEIKLRDSKSKLYSFYNYTLNVTGNCNANNNSSINQSEEENNNEDDDNEGDNDYEISLEIDWDSGDIVNGKEFEIRVKAYNLEDKDYDLKVFIYDDNENSPISQTYYDGQWLNSNNYMNKIFRGPSDEEDNIRLKIKDSFKSYEGEANLGVRLRESGASSYKEEIQEIIDITKEEEEDVEDDENNNIIEDSEEPGLIIEDNPEENLIAEEAVHHLDSKSESIKTKNDNEFSGISANLISQTPHQQYQHSLSHLQPLM